MTGSWPDPPALDPSTAPSWDELLKIVVATPTGARLRHEAEQHAVGAGPPHADALVRRFEAAVEDEIRVTLYRDAAAWCPYCQKVWLLLEEKRVPYRVVKVPLDAYGYKPTEYTRKVEGAKLPAIELDGELRTESADIMALLDATFPEQPMSPTSDAQAAALATLEADLQSAWFSLVFYPVEGAALTKAQAALEASLERLELALGETPQSPWLLGGDAPSLADVGLAPTMERLLASTLFWRGLRMRNEHERPHLERWLAAWEARPSYRATQADTYSLVMAMPSQNGPGYYSPEVHAAADRICGLRGAWTLGDTAGDSEAASGGEASVDAARHEAAYRLAANHAAVVKFAARGAAPAGQPSFHAELADPNAEPNEAFFAPVDVCLRITARALLDGGASPPAAPALHGACDGDALVDYWERYDDGDDGAPPYYWDDETGECVWVPPTRNVDNCLAYLRDRVGVPRDMSAGAAAQLRSHLNWCIGELTA